MSNALYAYNIKSSVWFIHRQGQFNECFDIRFSIHKWYCSDRLCRKDTTLNIKLVEISSFIANFDIHSKNQILKKKIVVLFNFFWHFREWILFWDIDPAENGVFLCKMFLFEGGSVYLLSQYSWSPKNKIFKEHGRKP